jgi:hypothetical protein
MVKLAQVKLEICGCSGDSVKKRLWGVAHDKGFCVDIAFCNSLGLCFVKKSAFGGFAKLLMSDINFAQAKIEISVLSAGGGFHKKASPGVAIFTRDFVLTFLFAIV